MKLRYKLLSAIIAALLCGCAAAIASLGKILADVALTPPLRAEELTVNLWALVACMGGMVAAVFAAAWKIKGLVDRLSSVEQKVDQIVDSCVACDLKKTQPLRHQAAVGNR